ncbi:MAG TPA: hypothetical protein VH538_12855 [Gaiellaceae bacterium]
MKLKIMVLMALGVAGAGASFALAANNSSHGHKAACRRTVLVGTASVPQSFDVTLSRTWRHTSLKPGQSVHVTMGSSGQTIRFTGVGCVGDDGTVTVSVAGFQVVQHRDRGGTTTTEPPTTTTAPSTTTSD